MSDLSKAAKIAFSSEFAFYLKAHNFHWNIEGPDFLEYHELFGKIYEEVYSSIDDFAEKIRIFIQNRIRYSLPKNIQLDEKRTDLFVNYSASASFGAVLWWLEHDMPYSSEEMIKTLQHLESLNLQSVST